MSKGRREKVADKMVADQKVAIQKGRRQNGRHVKFFIVNLEIFRSQQLKIKNNLGNAFSKRW